MPGEVPPTGHDQTPKISTSKLGLPISISSPKITVKLPEDQQQKEEEEEGKKKAKVIEQVDTEFSTDNDNDRRADGGGEVVEEGEERLEPLVSEWVIDQADRSDQ